MSEIDGRKLEDLRVVDLKAELEKRGLDKTGVKQVLIERLQKALDEDKSKETDENKGSDQIKGNIKEGVEEVSKETDENKVVDKSVEKVEQKEEDKVEQKVEEKVEEKVNENNEEKKDETLNQNGEEDEKPISIQKDAVEPTDKIEQVPAEDEKMDEGNVVEDKEKIEETPEIKDNEDVKDENLQVEDKMEDSTESDSKSSTKEEDPVSKEDAATEETSEVRGNVDIKDESEQEKTSQEEVKISTEENSNEETEEHHNEDTVVSPDEEKTEVQSTASKPVENVSMEIETTVTPDEKKAEEETKSKDGKEENQQNKNSEEKPAPPSKKICNDQNRNLWITNISQTTRASELKQALSEHGKVMGAKVVINARHPAACCYGYVKMETVADADNCIAKLNNTELNGQIIRIEKVRPDHLNPLKNKLEGKEKEKHLGAKPTLTSPAQQPKPDVKDDKKAEVKEPPKEKEDRSNKKEEKDKKSDDKKIEVSRRHVYRSKSPERKSRDRTHNRSTSRGRNERSLSSKSGQRGREREREILTFDKIRDEREREKMRERERILRDRRREEAAIQREIERKQRNEAVRLEREREKLRRERERLEKERAEFMQFERERQKIEREKLEVERIELERAKLRMQAEERRAVKRPAPSSTPYRERERSYEERKRVASERHFDEAPPPPRFDPPSLKSRDATPPVKKFPSAVTSNKDYKPRMNYDKRDTYPPKREYEDRSHPSSSISRGAPPVPKYDATQTYSGGRERGDIRDPRVREAGNLGSVSSSKYTSDNKVSRYNERERDRSPHFRSLRDERERRGAIPESKSDMRNPRSEHRYSDAHKDSVRYERTSSSGSNWNPQKVFGTTGGNPGNKQWTGKDSWRSENPSTAERWNAANAPRGAAGLTSSAFSNNAGMNMGPSCPPPPGINNYVNDRFDYKANMSGLRKY